MGRKSGGLGLIVGIVRAIERGSKNAERERLRRQREASTHAKVQEKLYEQERVRQDKELIRSMAEQQKRDKEREKEAGDRRIAQEKEAVRLAKEVERYQVVAARARALEHKDAERSSVLQVKEAITRELNEADAEFALRCNQRKNLRLEYLRTTLK